MLRDSCRSRFGKTHASGGAPVALWLWSARWIEFPEGAIPLSACAWRGHRASNHPINNQRVGSNEERKMEDHNDTTKFPGIKRWLGHRSVPAHRYVSRSGRADGVSIITAGNVGTP